MFSGLQLQPSNSLFRRSRAVAASVSLHLVLLGVLVFRHQPPIDLASDWLAHGDSAHTYRLIYFPPEIAADLTPPEAARLAFPSKPVKPRPKYQMQTPSKARDITTADASDHESHAGSALGTMIDGPMTGHEVHVAYPVVYPNPPVDRAELPRDLVGDVIIEVTIDSAGNVVETRIVQAIGHGIDEKIEATLRRWHYQPATLDGAPVASRHDVHFHFPS
jgi:TonB family protein